MESGVNNNYGNYYRRCWLVVSLPRVVDRGELASLGVVAVCLDIVLDINAHRLSSKLVDIVRFPDLFGTYSRDSFDRCRVVAVGRIGTCRKLGIKNLHCGVNLYWVFGDI